MEKGMTDKLFNEMCSKFTNALFIEIGAGNLVTEKLLMQFPGTSKIIDRIITPYSKQSQVEMLSWDDTNGRSVSEKFILHCMDKFENENMLVTSFQLSKDETSITHGWIGIKLSDIVYVFHTTVPNLSITYKGFDGKHIKLMYRNYIATTLERILSYIFEKNKQFINVDIATKYDMANMCHYDITFDMLDFTGMDTSHLIFIDEYGQPARVQEFFRTKDTVCIYKGSFAPISRAHLEIIKECKVDVVAISVNTYGKGTIDIIEIKKRIKQFTDIRMPVIIFTHPLFLDLYKHLQKALCNSKLKFAMGSDTFDRFSVDYKNNEALKNDFGNTEFIVFERCGMELKTQTNFDITLIKNEMLTTQEISSTQLRQQLLEVVK